MGKGLNSSFKIVVLELSLGYMLRDGASLTKPLTEHETIALACSQRGAMVESSESPYLSGENVNFSRLFLFIS